jgi:hypothetical protein
VVSERQPWTALVAWLQQITSECHEALQNGTLSAVGLDRIWIRMDKKAMLADFAVVNQDHQADRPDSNVFQLNDFISVQELAARVASACLGHELSKPYVPFRFCSDFMFFYQHRRDLLTCLAEHTFRNQEELTRNLRSVVEKDQQKLRYMTAVTFYFPILWAVLLPGSTRILSRWPFLLMVFLLMGLIYVVQIREWYLFRKS